MEGAITTTSRVAVMVLGGDPALCGQPRQTTRERDGILKRAARAVLAVVSEGFRVVVIPPAYDELDTALARTEESAHRVRAQPLHTLLAAIQAQVSADLERAIRNEASRSARRLNVTSVLSHSLVAADDPGFAHPSRPIGPSMHNSQAKEVSKFRGVDVMEQPDAGWREVVPSLRPIKPLGLSGIEALLGHIEVVVTGAGGGIPACVDDAGVLSPTRGLLSERRLGALLAQELAADLLIVLQEAECIEVSCESGKPKALTVVDRHELRALLEKSRFTAPEATATVEDALSFLEGGGHAVVVTNTVRLPAALSNRRGTRIGAAFKDAQHQAQFQLFEDELPPPVT